VSAPLIADRRGLLRRRIRLLVAATITYNVIEAIVAITAGTIADSVALIGFGLDSVIEVASAAAVAWQFAGPDPERREKVALRVIAGSFFALAAYVTVEAFRTLFGAAEPEHSTVGIVLVAISVVIMPFLSWAQRRAGREFGSASAVADSKQTLLCTYLSAAVLVGLVLNSTMGWWWADPLVALGLAVVAVREGREALRGETCCAPVHLQLDEGGEPAADACGCADGCTGPCCAGNGPATETGGPDGARGPRARRSARPPRP
jgi:divalent metal cation (Fe/Co/Zn/Cd) transporter